VNRYQVTLEVVADYTDDNDSLVRWFQEGVALILDIDLKLREQPSVADEVSIL